MLINFDTVYTLLQLEKPRNIKLVIIEVLKINTLGSYMNKLLINLALSTLMFSMSLFVHASAAENVLKIDSYNKELKTAIRAYKNNDYVKALPQLELFAKRGDKMSQYIVGIMYLNAQGTEQDLMKSYGWLTVANEQRSKTWAQPLNMIESKLSVDYMTELKLESKKYLQQYGAKNQRLKCKNVRELGSKQPIHRCKKVEIVNGYYYVNDQEQYSAKLD
jgi:TPR repeat protein